MELIELKSLFTVCDFEGVRNIRAAIAPWDSDGFVLMVKSKTKTYLLRTKNQPTPRIFKSIDTAIGICQHLGFVSVNVTFNQQKFSYDKPKWTITD